MASSHKDAAIEFMRLVVAGRIHEAYEKHVGTGFRHHNPHFRGDAASLMTGMEQSAAQNPNKVLDVQIALEEGNCVAIFSHLRQSPQDRGGAVVHIFRFDQDRIVELWDVGQQIPEQSVNEHGMF